jgi:hypothetical protein
MSKRITGRKWFDTIRFGPIFDAEKDGDTGIDEEETHRYRDKNLIAYLRQYGEILANGLAEPREVGRYMMEMADEAEAIEKEIRFWYA